MRAAALALVAVGFFVTLLPGPWGADDVTDLPIYAAYADAFLAGALPYRDVPFEYPPLAAPLLALPGLGGNYEPAFGLLALALACAVVLLAGAIAVRTGGDRREALLAAAALPLLLGAIVRARFDLAPVALVLGGLLLVCSARPRAGMAALGLGAATKLFPLLIAPVVLAWLVARGQRRAAAESAAVLAIVLLAIFGAAAALSPAGLVDSLTYHVERPVQVESTPAVVLNALGALGAEEPRPVHSHGSDGLLHPASGLVSGGFMALLAATLVGLVLGVGRGRSGTLELVLASLTAVAAFAAFGKVLSPQFLIWVAPLGALALAWRMHALAAAVAAASLLTLVEFPARYEDVLARTPTALTLVAARDIALVGVVVLACRELASGPSRNVRQGMTRPRQRQARTQGARIAALFGRLRTPHGGDLGPSFR